jgi:hypothetical protein
MILARSKRTFFISAEMFMKKTPVSDLRIRPFLRVGEVPGILSIKLEPQSL